jgi:hypothetical protein
LTDVYQRKTSLTLMIAEKAFGDGLVMALKTNHFAHPATRLI